MPSAVSAIRSHQPPKLHLLYLFLGTDSWAHCQAKFSIYSSLLPSGLAHSTLLSLYPSLAFFLPLVFFFYVFAKSLTLCLLSSILFSHISAQLLEFIWASPSWLLTIGFLNLNQFFFSIFLLPSVICHFILFFRFFIFIALIYLNIFGIFPRFKIFFYPPIGTYFASNIAFWN